LKKYTPLLIFEEFLERTWLFKISLCWDICPCFYFSFSSLFSSFFSLFSEHPSLFLDIWIEVVVKGILGALCVTKGLAMDEGKFFMLTPSVGVEQF
jgi:hypothetical protein